MRSQIGLKYFLIPVLYVGVIFSLFYLQFSNKFGPDPSGKPSQTEIKTVEIPAEKPGTKTTTAPEKPAQKSFSDSIAGFTVKGSSIQGGNDRSSGVTELTVSGLGLSFSFSRGKGLVCTTQEGSELAADLIGYKKNRDGLELLFQNGIRLVFDFIDSGAGLRVLPRMEDNAAAITSIAFPAETAPRTIADFEKDIPAATVNTAAGTYFLTAPMGSRFMPENGRILLAAEGNEGLSLLKATDSGKTVAAWWYDKNGSSITEEQYVRSVEAFMKKVYAGWKSGRYNAAQGTWKMADGTFAFNENILVYFLAESMTRGEIEPVLKAMTAAAAQHPEQTGLRSNPWLGDLMKSTSRQRASDNVLALRVRSLFAKKDVSLFADPALIAYVTERAPTAIRKEFLKYAAEVNVKDIDIRTLLGMVATALNETAFTRQELQTLNRFTELLKTRIQSGLIRVGDSLFLQESPSSISPERSLVAGRLMIRAGKKTGDAYMQSSGRHLVVSALALADKDGFLPGMMTAGDNGSLKKDGQTDPEYSYSFLTENRYIPRRVDLPQAGPDTWLWTIAPFTVESIEGGFKLTCPGTQDWIHNVVIQGLKPFKDIYLYSTKWRSTNLFQNYAYGLFYDPKVETLYLKLKHKTASEEILFFYTDQHEVPQAPAAQNTGMPEAEPSIPVSR